MTVRSVVVITHVPHPHLLYWYCFFVFLFFRFLVLLSTGVSSREAARALITLFNPKKPVPSSTSLSLEDQESEEESFGDHGSPSSPTATHNYSSSPKSSPSSSSPIKRTSFNRINQRSQSFVAVAAGNSNNSSGGGASPSKLPPLLHSHSLTFSPTSSLESHSYKGLSGLPHNAAASAVASTGAKSGVDANAIAEVITSTTTTSTSTTSSTTTTTSSTTTLSSSSGTGYNGRDMMSSLFLSEDYARPWRFSYYHKRYLILLLS